MGVLYPMLDAKNSFFRFIRCCCWGQCFTNTSCLLFPFQILLQWYNSLATAKRWVRKVITPIIAPTKMVEFKSMQPTVVSINHPSSATLINFDDNQYICFKYLECCLHKLNIKMYEICFSIFPQGI